MKKLLLFILLTVFSFGGVTCTLPDIDYYWKFDTTVSPNPTVQNASYTTKVTYVTTGATYITYTEPPDTQTCNSYSAVFYDRNFPGSDYIYTTSGSFDYWKKDGTMTSYYYKAVPIPICDDNETLDTSVNPYQCVSNIPECTYPEVLNDTNTSCIIPDTDNDGIPDHEDTDDDNDGYSDYLELQDNTDPLDSNSNSGTGGDGGGLDSGYCPANQINYGTLQDTNCRCSSGLNGTIVDGELVCPDPDCALTFVSAGYTLSLRQQNETADICYGSYPTSLYNVSFTSNSINTCCYASARKDLDNDKTCPDGFHLNSTGNCVENDLPPLDLPDCPAGQTWNNFTQRCDTNVADSEAGEGGSGGASSDGTDGYNSNPDLNGTDIPYSGGDNTFDDGSRITDGVVLEFNNDEVNDMLQNFSNKANQTIGDFISENASDLMKFYTISIPLNPSCGCTNISYDLELAGNSFSDTIDVCTPLTSILDIMRPLLWFIFLVGTLFAFFRGGN